jgi:hypothetical protein
VAGAAAEAGSANTVGAATMASAVSGTAMARVDMMDLLDRQG